jgi:hypothetical protein
MDSDPIARSSTDALTLGSSDQFLDTLIVLKCAVRLKLRLSIKLWVCRIEQNIPTVWRNHRWDPQREAGLRGNPIIAKSAARLEAWNALLEIERRVLNVHVLKTGRVQVITVE